MTAEHNGTIQTALVTPAKLTMVVPVWNQLDFTVRLIESLRRFVHVPYRLVIVDNGSSDGTTEYVKSLVRANPERVIGVFNHSNRGFARAMNQGMEHVVGHMLWLNNDVEIVRPGSIEKLLSWVESDPKIGAVGPVTDACLGPQMITDSKMYPPFHPARYLIGFCLLVSEKAWRTVGKLDERFTDAGEDDLDYSIRVRQAGFSLGIDREVFVHHFGGVSMRKRYEHDPKKYHEALGVGRGFLIEKHGKATVDEIFLPPNFQGVRVMVSIPVWGNVYPEAYANQVGALLREQKSCADTNMDIVFAPMIRSSICAARNELVRMAKKLECTHLFFLDDDMIMPDYAIHRLVRVNRDIVSGLCFLRTPPHFPSMFMDPNDGTGRIFYIKDWPQNQLIRVDAVGSACVLIKTEVFEKIEEMAFPGDSVTCPNCQHVHIPWPVKEAKQDLWYLYGKARPGEHTVGEDVFFCRLARQAGFQVWADTSIEFGHVGPPLIYDTEYFTRVRQQALQNQQDLHGVQYTDYESACRYAREVAGILTPEELAARMGGGGSRGEVYRRLYAGAVGDGRNPGPASAASGRSVEHVGMGSPGNTV